MWSCTNEDESYTDKVSHGLGIEAEFLKLSDNGTVNAGTLLITADVPEVKVQWNTNGSYNIDTVQTVVKISGGKGTLPIRWREKGENGLYGPSNMAYNAGVMVTAGQQSQYVPLIWAEKVDTTCVLRNLSRTRAATAVMPRTEDITFIPAVLPLNDTKGGTGLVLLNNVDLVLFNYANLNASQHIDMSLLPDTIQSNRSLEFKWTAEGAPTVGFDVEIYAYATTGYSTSLRITYTPAGGVTPPVKDLEFVSSTLPTDNIPYSGDNYIFTFKGTYAGRLQIRPVVDGVAQTAGESVTDKQPKCTVSANTLSTTRNITFEYKREDGDWVALPESTNRIQDANNGGGDNPGEGSISLITVSPQSSTISEYGDSIKFSFQGTFTGNIGVRATSGGQLITAASGKVNTQIELIIPQLFGMNRMIIFEYSIDGGKNWLEVEQRNQINETFASGLIFPSGTTIPASGQGLRWSFSGTYSRKVTWIAMSGGEVLVEQTANGPTLAIVVPENKTGQNREVIFMYKMEAGTWVTMEHRTQLAK